MDGWMTFFLQGKRTNAAPAALSARWIRSSSPFQAPCCLGDGVGLGGSSSVLDGLGGHLLQARIASCSSSRSGSHARFFCRRSSGSTRANMSSLCLRFSCAMILLITLATKRLRISLTSASGSPLSSNGRILYSMYARRSLIDDDEAEKGILRSLRRTRDLRMMRIDDDDDR